MKEFHSLWGRISINNKDDFDLGENIESIDITKFPITTNAFTWTPLSMLLYLMLHILSFFIPFAMILTFYNGALDSDMLNNWWRMVFIFIDIMVWWGLYLLASLFFSKLFLIILELIHKPREGLFKLKKGDKDYYFYCLRISIKKFLFWTWNNFCFPWVSNLAFKICNMRADYKSTMFDGWSDVEFIEYGNNIMLGQGAVVFSSMIIGDHLLIKKVIIGDHVVIGGNSIVAPGTVIGRGTTLGVWASTHIGQILEPDWIYIGRPAQKYKPAITYYEETKKESEIGTYRRIVDTGERVPHKVNRYVKKDLIAIAIENLEKLYDQWKESIEVKSKKELKKKYEKSKKEIKLDDCIIFN
jgi:carbonic anhydrase/acetyltransferase-like protein (isoleucine patch superfamily)